jgi:hypothetical protein
MLTVTFVLAIAALICAIGALAGRVPVGVAPLLLAILETLRLMPR